MKTFLDYPNMSQGPCKTGIEGSRAGFVAGKGKERDSPSEPPRGKQTLAFRTSDFWKRTIKNLCSLKSLSSCHLLQQPQEAHTDYIWRDDSKPQHHRELGVLEGMRRCGDTDGGQRG